MYWCSNSPEKWNLETQSVLKLVGITLEINFFVRCLNQVRALVINSATLRFSKHCANFHRSDNVIILHSASDSLSILILFSCAFLRHNNNTSMSDSVAAVAPTPVKATPSKAVAKPKAASAKAKKPADHPKYSQMIKEALTSLKVS